ncbi:hypothetical protein [Frigoribacterium sp. PhB24]|nr:hypothetical protein [Frigoribacterium sp. PhB24]ROS47938.1 hypothetical protein EDF50_3280 [Frigoribacterium sp. PhB24]
MTITDQELVDSIAAVLPVPTKGTAVDSLTRLGWVSGRVSGLYVDYLELD